MKKLILVQILCATLLLGLLVTDSMAVGLGFYTRWGSGNADGKMEYDAWNYYYDDWNYYYDDRNDRNSRDVDVDTKYNGFGFVFDTAVAKNRLFNYRLSLGIEECEHKLDNGWATLELDSFVIDQDFGFALLRKPLGGSGSLRLWIGPELRISFSNGSWDDREDSDVDLYGIGIGPVLGLNLNAGPVFTLGIKTGYLTGAFGGEAEYTTNDRTYTYTDVTESHFFVNFAIIFRIKDTL